MQEVVAILSGMTALVIWHFTSIYLGSKLYSHDPELEDEVLIIGMGNFLGDLAILIFTVYLAFGV